MKTNKEVATLFSGGNFAAVAHNLATNIEWHIYENDLYLQGKENVLEFGEKVAAYFESITTKFELFGIMEEANKVSIYGRAEFIKEGNVINKVHSCDVYEFGEFATIQRIFSYCNSKKPTE